MMKVSRTAAENAGKEPSRRSGRVRSLCFTLNKQQQQCHPREAARAVGLMARSDAFAKVGLQSIGWATHQTSTESSQKPFLVRCPRYCDRSRSSNLAYVEPPGLFQPNASNTVARSHSRTRVHNCALAIKSFVPEPNFCMVETKTPTSENRRRESIRAMRG